MRARNAELPAEEEIPTWVIVLIIIFVIVVITFGGHYMGGRVGGSWAVQGVVEVAPAAEEGADALGAVDPQESGNHL